MINKIFRTLIIHPTGDYNCGDKLTFLGAKSLLTQAAGGSQYVDVLQFDYERAEIESDTYASEYGWRQVDLIVLAGSPWIWNECHKSKKYKILSDACRRWPNAKKIALGLGSSLSHKDFEDVYYGAGAQHDFFKDINCMKSLHDVYSKFDLIVVRDLLAKRIFDELRLSSIDTFDTSVYAYRPLSKKFNEHTLPREKKVCFFYDPAHGLSREDLLFSARDYHKKQLDWLEQNDAEIYVNALEDGFILGDRPYNFSVDAQFLFHYFMQCKEMLSGRVHMAMLGFLAGIPKITVLPVDSRFMTVLKFPIDVEYVGNAFNLPKIEIDKSWDNIFREENRLVKCIQEVLENHDRSL